MQPWPCYVDQLRTIPYMDAMHAEWLREYAEDAESILEWGCGGSTIWLAQIAKGKLLSIEHDEVWREKVDTVIIRLDSMIPLAEWLIALRTERADYCNPLCQCDLAFIDGKAEWRLDCLAACVKCVKPGGHIFLHDSQRHPRELVSFSAEHCQTSEQRLDSIGVGMWHAQLKG